VISPKAVPYPCQKGYRVRQRSHCQRREHPDRRSQRTSVANRQHVKAAEPRPAFPLHLVGQPVSAPLSHRLVPPDIFGRDLPTVLDQVLRDRARVLPVAHGRSERAREAARGGAEVDGGRTRGEQEIEDRGEVRRERFGRGEVFGRRVGRSQSASKVLRDAERRERRDSWCAPDLPPRKQCVHSVRCVGWRWRWRWRCARTFIVFIASWACAMLSMDCHSVVCGRRS